MKQKYMERVSALTDFLANGKHAIDEVCKFLILNTFNDFKPQAIYLGQLLTDGTLLLKSSFGFDSKYISQWERIPFSINIPVNNAIRNNQVYLYTQQEDFFLQHPDVESLGIVSRDWNSCFAAPVKNLGSYFVVSNGRIETSDEFEHFARSVGNLIAIHITDQGPAFQPVSKQTDALSSSTTLTERQQIIKNLVVKGFSNPQIASEIGYSESLVRQETIAIYSMLRVSGRKELMKLVEKEAITEA